MIYVGKKGEKCEDFLKFLHCKSDLTGKDLFKEVVNTLNELGFDLKNCRGQGWVSTIDGLDVFEDILTYVVLTFEYFHLTLDSNVDPRDNVAKAQVLLNHVTNFNFIVTLVVTRKVFEYTHSVTELIQAKLNDIVKGFDLTGSLIDLFVDVTHDIDDYHEKWYKEALELSKKN